MIFEAAMPKKDIVRFYRAIAKKEVKNGRGSNMSLNNPEPQHLIHFDDRVLCRPSRRKTIHKGQVSTIGKMSGPSITRIELRTLIADRPPAQIRN